MDISFELHIHIKVYDKAEVMDTSLGFSGKVNSWLLLSLLKTMQLVFSKFQK